MDIKLACVSRDLQTRQMIEVAGLEELDYPEEQVYFLNDKRLDLSRSLKVANHSPTGFNHGYSGSGPAQLALAICTELYGEKAALMVYRYFKSDFIAPIQLIDDWSINLDVPDDALAYYKLELPEESPDDYSAEEGTADITDQDRYLEEQIEEEGKRRMKENLSRLDKRIQERLRLPRSFKYEFQGFCGLSYCYINIVQHKGRIIIIATDAGVESDDAGTSVTNAVEIIATGICKEFNIDPARMEFIERYIHKVGSRFDPSLEENWDKVFLHYNSRGFKSHKTEWKRIDTNEWQDLEKIWFDKEGKNY